MINTIRKLYLKLKYGKKVIIGKGVTIYGLPSIVLGKNSKIIFSDYTVIKRACDFRAYNESSIIIGHNCKVDDGVRIIAGNGNNVVLGTNVKIGYYSVLNGGGGITIGNNTSTYGFVYIQSSVHTVNEKNTFEKEGYSHLNVTIEDDCLIQPHCCIMPGSAITKKSIIPPHSILEPN